MLRAPIDAALVRPARRASGRVQVPGDKSISHRYALLGAIADGRHAYLRLFLRRRLRRHPRLPARPRRPRSTKRGTRRGNHRPGPPRPDRRRQVRSTPPIPARRCGCCPGLLAAHPFRTTIVRRRVATRRPMRRVIEPLTGWGRPFESDDGRPPLTIDGRTTFTASPTGPRCRAPRSRAASCWPASSRGPDRRRRARRDTGSYGAGPGGVRRNARP